MGKKIFWRIRKSHVCHRDRKRTGSVNVGEREGRNRYKKEAIVPVAEETACRPGKCEARRK